VVCVRASFSPYPAISCPRIVQLFIMINPKGQGEDVATEPWTFEAKQGHSLLQFSFGPLASPANIYQIIHRKR
jgi:hypothetical protein